MPTDELFFEDEEAMDYDPWMQIPPRETWPDGDTFTIPDVSYLDLGFYPYEDVIFED